MPIAGAPRTASVLMQSATCGRALAAQPALLARGARRWSSTSSAPSSKRSGSIGSGTERRRKARPRRRRGRAYAATG